MELTNVSAELKTSASQLVVLKKEQQNLTKELEDTKNNLSEQQKNEKSKLDNKDNIISKLRQLAKKYKGWCHMPPMLCIFFLLLALITHFLKILKLRDNCTRLM
jgi:hypothetical protein